MKNTMLKKKMPLVAATWTDAFRRVRNHIALVAAAICAAGTVTAATWGGGTSSDVGDPTNWDTQTVPGSSDAVTINKNSPVATISSGQTYTWTRLLIANGANTSGTLTVLAGASLRTSNGDDILSNGNSAKSVLNINGGDVSLARLRAPHESGTYGNATINLTDGTLEIRGMTDIGRARSTVTINQSGGTFTARGRFALGSYASSGARSSTTYNLTGGTFLQAGNHFYIGRDNPNNATVNVRGGDLTGASGCNLYLANASNPQGTLNVYSGTVSFPVVYVGKAGTGTMNQYGGTTTASVILGNDSAGKGTFRLYGGALIAPYVVGGSGTATMVVSNATIKVTADTGSGNNGKIFSNVDTLTYEAGVFTIDTDGHTATLYAGATTTAKPGSSLVKIGAGTLSTAGAIPPVDTITVQEGTFAVAAASGAFAGSIIANSGTALKLAGPSSIGNLTIPDGMTIDLSGRTSVLSITGNLTIPDNATINVSLGELSPLLGTKIVGWESAPANLASITFNCTDGTLIKRDDGLYTPVYRLKSTGARYASIAEALTAAGTGDATIELLADSSGDVAIGEKDVTLVSDDTTTPTVRILTVPTGVTGTGTISLDTVELDITGGTATSPRFSLDSENALIRVSGGAAVTAGNLVTTISGYVVDEKNGTYRTVPIVAMIGDTPFGSVANALASGLASAEHPVRLIADVDESDRGTTTLPEGAVIDLDGHSLTLSEVRGLGTGATITSATAATLTTYSGTLYPGVTLNGSATIAKSATTVSIASWSGTVGTDVWDYRNWTCNIPGALPTANTAVTINKNSPVATMSCGQTNSWTRLLIANGANTSGTLTVLAGARLYTSSGDDIMSNGDNAKSVLNINGGEVSLARLRMPHDSGSNGNATINITDGSLEIRGYADIGRNGSTVAINQSGGTVTARSRFALGSYSSADKSTTYNMTGGSFVQAGDHLYIGRDNANHATFNLRGGDVSGGSGHYLYLANANANTQGTLNMYGGTVSFPNVYIGVAGKGTMNVYGGTNTYTSAVILANSSGSTGTLTLRGGVMKAPYVKKGSGTATVAVSNGTFTVTASTGSGDNGKIFLNVNTLTYEAGVFTIDTDGHTATLYAGATTTAKPGSSLVKAGAGMLTTAALPPVSTITVEAGTLALSADCDNAESEVQRTLSIASGATFDLGGHALTQPVVKGDGTISTGTLVVSDKIIAKPGDCLEASGTIDLSNAEIEVDDPESLDAPFTFLKPIAGQTLTVTGVPTPTNLTKRWKVSVSANGTGRIVKRGFVILVK